MFYFNLRDSPRKKKEACFWSKLMLKTIFFIKIPMGPISCSFRNRDYDSGLLTRHLNIGFEHLFVSVYKGQPNIKHTHAFRIG